MPLQYSTNGRLVRVRATEAVRERDYMEMLSALAEKKALNTPVLFTFSEDASLSEIDIAALTRIRAHFMKLLGAQPGPPVKTAWVTSDEGSASVIRLWRALADTESGPNRRIRIFSNERDALTWLSDPIG